VVGSKDTTPRVRQIGCCTGCCTASAALRNLGQAVADRYYHQLHPKPWAKSPEEAAWALMQRIMGLGQWDGSRSWFRWSSPPSMTLASKYCPVDNPVQAFSTKLSRD
jgi:hypothetical protein